MKAAVVQRVTRWVEAGRLPDALVRAGIRYNIGDRERELAGLNADLATEAFVAQMDDSPVALVPELANTQHYEIPADFYRLVLGPHRKYSCCLWDDGVSTLAEAEALALQQVADRAGIEDGMRVLDLGCGWGSFSLWAAARFPGIRITAVSNSSSQAEFIRTSARTRGIDTICVVTGDMNDFEPGDRFDRIISIEMFEHMRNWRRLFARLSHWLTPGGRLFLHVFSHATVAYPYEIRDAGDWMSRYFFTGGMMPSHGLAGRVLNPLICLEDWRIDGTHYTRTANAWLSNLDRHRDEVLACFADVYGPSAELWLHRWRIFFMACAEMFAWNRGQTWGVSQYSIGRQRP